MTASVRRYLLCALLLLCCLSLTACAKDAPLAEPLAPVEEEPAISESVLEESGLVWRVEPTLEYDKIWYCAIHDVFNRNNQEGGSLDPKTGLLTDEYHGGHGYGGTIYLYDAKKNIYGSYSGDDAGSYLELLSPDEFFNDPNRRNRLLAVEKIDSALIAEYEGVESYGLGDAHTGIFAIMYGSEFVSDFIYGYDTWDDGVNRDNIIAVRLDDKMGALDINGNIVIPFVLEDIVFIDQETAFAKINGKYGILELPALPENSITAEALATYITTDNVNLREAPGTDSARITTVPKGTSVEVFDFLDGEWYLVEYEGQEGYMKAEFLAKVENGADISPENTGQSKVPYLGKEEVTPLFAGRSTIADWIKDVKMDDVEYSFYVEGATGYARLDIDTTFFRIASFYIEDNSIAEILYDDEQGKYKILPDQILALEVLDVLDLDFEYMGVPYNIRGITKGTAANDVKLAFLDGKKEKVFHEDYAGLYTQELYNSQDVDPSAVAENESVYSPFIGGIDCETDDPEYTHNCVRIISYFHTSQQEDHYTIYNQRSMISFYIDENGKVAAFSYADISHRN